MLYQEQVRRYKEQEVKERAIHSWMASTVLPSVHASALEMIRKDNGVTALLWLHLDCYRQLATELKAKFAQDPVVSSAATVSRYLDLLRQAHVGGVEPERLIADWNVMYDVPEGD
ncbi:hypothetical protein E4U15_003425 [Claviceps sp. LM218 group G6]|nr:hypothetical protein E4U15_003425 [Claviceps sp. LM218 group G6]